MTDFYDNRSLDRKLLLARAWLENRRIWSSKCFEAWQESLSLLSSKVQR